MTRWATLRRRVPMRGYAVAMFVHILGLVAVFGGFILQHRAAARLRAAVSQGEGHPWAELLVASRTMVPSGAAMLLLSGAYLSRSLWSDFPAWILVALVAVLFIGIAGLVFGQRFAALATALRSGDGPVAGDARAHLSARSLWGLHAAANGATLGSIWLMTARPALLESALAVALPAVVGAVVGARLAAKQSGQPRATNVPATRTTA
jgi:hypothetical protein